MNKLTKKEIKAYKKAYKNASGIGVETRPVDKITNTPFVTVSYKEFKSPDQLRQMKKDY